MSFIPRSCFEPGGLCHTYTGGKCRPLPPHVAGRESNDFFGKKEFRDVPWSEIMDRRRARQAEQLASIRRPATPRILPCYVWTFLNEQDFPYGGWYCYVVTRHTPDLAVNFRGFHSTLALSLMAEIQVGVLPLPECFLLWMKEFTRRHPRRKRADDPRKAGLHYGWLNHETVFSIQHP